MFQLYINIFLSGIFTATINYVGFFFNYESILAKIQLNLSKRKSLKLFAQGELKVIYRKPNVGRMDTVKI
jgi:hypothetical protein